MAVRPSPQATVGDTTPVKLNTFADAAPNTGSNTFQRDYGSALAIKTDGPLHFGGSNAVRNAAGSGVVRGALFDAGFYSFDLSSDDNIYVIAPAGQTVHVEILQLGVVSS